MHLNDDMLRAAIRGYEEKLRLVDVQIASLSRRLAGESMPEPRPKTRRISAAGRKRISIAQKKRWAAQKKQSAA